MKTLRSMKDLAHSISRKFAITGTWLPLDGSEDHLVDVVVNNRKIFPDRSLIDCHAVVAAAHDPNINVQSFQELLHANASLPSPLPLNRLSSNIILPTTRLINNIIKTKMNERKTDERDERKTTADKKNDEKDHLWFFNIHRFTKEGLIHELKKHGKENLVKEYMNKEKIARLLISNNIPVPL